MVEALRLQRAGHAGAAGGVEQVTWFSGIVLTILGFLVGRVFSQSETILADKRRVYEEFLRNCPVPNDAYENWAPSLESERLRKLHDVHGPFTLYASPTVTQALARYLDAFAEADRELSEESLPLHPKFKVAAKAHNDLILEMRRDVLAWSVFAYRGKSRLPSNAVGDGEK